MPAMPCVLFDLDDTIIDFTSNVTAARLQARSRPALRHGVQSAALDRAFAAAAAQFWADPDLARDGRRDLIAASANILRRAGDVLRLQISADEALALSREYRSLRDEGVR